MPVFISHRTLDNALANHVAARLTQTHGIQCYTDDIDQKLKQESEQEVTRILVDMVNKCTNLLAVITKNTEGSWWVPYEIGVAKQAPRVICSMTDLSDGSLPGYLKEWPRLRGDSAIDQFAALYKAQKLLLKENVLENRATASTQFSTVQGFESRLKTLLHQ